MGGEGEPWGLRREMGFGEREKGLVKEFGHRTALPVTRALPTVPGKYPLPIFAMGGPCARDGL